MVHVEIEKSTTKIQEILTLIDLVSFLTMKEIHPTDIDKENLVKMIHSIQKTFFSKSILFMTNQPHEKISLVSTKN